MPSHYEQCRHRGVPFDRDLLEGDLDAHFPAFSEGRALWWGLAIRAIPNSWEEDVVLPGVDWIVQIHAPGTLKIPEGVRRNSPRTTWHTIKENSALLGVSTGRSDLNGARDVGRLGVRRLASLVRRELPALLLSDVVWEGALVRTQRGTLKMMLAQFGIEGVEPKDRTLLSKAGMKLLPIAIGDLPPTLARSLEWLALARSSRVRTEKFTHTWLSITALADQGQVRRNSHQRERIDAYVATMRDVLGGRDRGALKERLNQYYDARNSLWHEGNVSGITPELLDSMESDAFTLVDFEFVKLGTPILS